MQTECLQHFGGLCYVGQLYVNKGYRVDFAAEYFSAIGNPCRFAIGNTTLKSTPLRHVINVTACTHGENVIFTHEVTRSTTSHFCKSLFNEPAFHEAFSLEELPHLLGGFGGTADL